MPASACNLRIPMKTSRVRPSFALLAATSLMLCTQSVLAAPEAAKAAPAAPTKLVPTKAPTEAELLKAAAKAQKAGDTKAAVESYAAAEKAGEKNGKAKPATVLALAKAYDADKRYADAIGRYDAYVALAPKTAKKDIDAATARSAELKAMKPKLTLSGTLPQGSLVTVDGAELKGTELEVSPGEHLIKVTKDGYEPLELKAQVPVATDTTVAVALKELPPPPPPPPAVAPVADPLPPKVAEAPAAATQAASHDKTAAYVTGGIAVLAAGSGALFGVMALSEKSDFDKTPTKKGADRAENYSLVADMSFGLAITFGLTSAVLFLTDDQEPSADKAKAATNHTPKPLQIRPIPMLAPGMAGAGATVRF